MSDRSAKRVKLMGFFNTHDQSIAFRDVIKHISHFLEPRDVVHLGECNKKLQDICFSDEIWKSKFEKDSKDLTMIPVQSVHADNEPWLQSYKSIWPFIKIQDQYKDIVTKITTDYPSIDIEKLHKALSPCIELRLRISSEKKNTKFGGLPLVDENFVWPERNNNPLNFVMQIDFGEVSGMNPLVAAHYKLPKDGLISIFADDDNTKVFYYEASQIDSLTEVEEEEEHEDEEASGSDEEHEEMFLETYPALCLKHPCNWDPRALVSKDQADDFYDLIRDICSEYGQDDKMLGWAGPINNDIGLTKNHVLLLQLGESITGYGYNDDGRMYWEIPATDLQAKKFDSVKHFVDC